MSPFTSLQATEGSALAKRERGDEAVSSTAFDNGNGVICWDVDGEFYVYAGEKLVRVCPSIGMARELAAGL